MMVKIRKGWRIIIPSKFRKEFGWLDGSNVELTKEGNKVVIKPVGDDLQKLFKDSKNLKAKSKLTAKQMDEVVEREVNKYYGASKRKTTNKQRHEAGEKAFDEIASA